jgi:hypothetical protein
MAKFKKEKKNRLALEGGLATTKDQTIFFFFFGHWGWLPSPRATPGQPTPNWGGQLPFNFYFIFLI